MIFEILCREQVKIPREKPYIYLKGEGKGRTNVTWDGHESIATDATFISEADYTVVKSITFIVRQQNLFNFLEHYSLLKKREYLIEFIKN